MNRNWSDFKALYGNIAGAREEFENACESLFRKMNPDKHVSQMKVTVGDGGIDVFIGEFGVEPITVIQCKFFLDSFGDSQKNQIRDSFKTAIESEKYELKEWILCIPRIIDINENSWWFEWKTKKIKEHSKEIDFIKIKNGNELIDLLKEHNLYNQYFKIEDSLKIDAILHAVVPKKPEIPVDINPQIVLFNNYSKKCESYYFEREVDKEFINSLKISNIWVFGSSGIGKTALVNRNLTKNEIEYCFCDLSPVDISSSDQVIEEILCKVEERFCTERDCSKTNRIKQITHILGNENKKKIIIVIDELSVKDNDVLKKIATDLMNLVIHYNNSIEDSQLKFVVSTISSPQEIIDNQSKATEYFQYIDCNDWSKDIENFYEVLATSLNLDLKDSKEAILTSSKDSPRILKSIFRKIIALDNVNTISIDNAIKKTTSELVS
ncbi:restriction endonuclease [Epilithonimonas sp.]|uniref:restriction endonuclease n=1 Tax=Epilithonimonas sp. TaxID=2894511 RepID=UPI0028A00628|nr:restriction endonuclease [Epilithonimonas sp.]